ncbi:2-methylcitrate dehydratase PrpD [Streptosporangium album]|uniref:2-methylcitrate dehydratase PrpD n=2 Tax=Streptosporangium album TaxID=47479 RepID=A0A7W7S5A5_9ACTN|nr:2-methylcitrate dehydratase PrpD [Streptosporangium album]
MGAGLLEANRADGTVKRVHCGWAAHAGVTAAALAREGLTGPPTVLEGRFGFFAAYLDGRGDADALLAGLGKRWEVTRAVYKPYPANHFTHPAIDCAFALRAGDLDPGDIEEIELGVPARLALAGRVRCVADDRASGLFPLSFGAVLRIRTRGGTTLTHRVDSSRGGPGNPLSSEELALKFRLNASRALPEEAVTALDRRIAGPAEAQDARHIALISPVT